MSINQTLGEYYDDESLKERYVFLYDLPSLQEIASYEVCRTIWYSNLSKFQLIEAEDTNIIHCRIMIGFYLFFHYQKHNEQLIKHLNVPASIEGILGNSMTKVCKEIEDWVTEFYCWTLDLEGHSRIHLIDPKWWVWSVNGEIDCLKSARRILQDIRLTDWQKFLVMCRYCMADEISKFSLDCLPSQFFAKNYHESNFICFYWICYLRNELHRVPVRNNDSIAWTISKYHADFQVVKKFFWDRLNDDEQVTLVADWINESTREDKKINFYLEQFISKMSLSQQQRLLRGTIHEIVTFFASYSDSSRCALWAWRYAGNQMAVEHFTTLVETLLLETSINEKSTPLLNEIWNTASAHQRNHVIQYKLDDFMDILLFDNGSSCSDRFLLFISEDERKELIFRLVKRNGIIQHCDVDYLSNFLNEYLPRPEDQLTLKKLVVDSPAFAKNLQYLFKYGKYKTIDEILRFYFSHDTAAAKLFKRDFLEQKLKTMDFPFDFKLITSIDKWNGLSQFIDELVFDEDPKLGSMVKQWFITSTFTHNISKIWDSENTSYLSQSFDDFVKIVETVFKNDELENVKRLFFDKFSSIPTGPSRDGFHYVVRMREDVFLLNFMQWCSPHSGKPFLKL